MLGIAYSASIGSLSTIIGTPPNAFLIGYLRQDLGISIGFGQWMLFAMPMSIVLPRHHLVAADDAGSTRPRSTRSPAAAS